MNRFIFLSVTIFLVATCVGCGKRDVWKEEVRLSNGELIVLDRENYYGEFDSNIYKPPVTASLIRFKYNNQNISFLVRKLTPLALQIDRNGNLFIVTAREIPVQCKDSDKYLSMYEIFRYVDGKWVSGLRKDIPTEVVSNLSPSAKGIHSSHFVEYMRENDAKLNATNVRYLQRMLPLQENQVERCIAE